MPNLPKGQGSSIIKKNQSPESLTDSGVQQEQSIIGKDLSAQQYSISKAPKELNIQDPGSGTIDKTLNKTEYSSKTTIIESRTTKLQALMQRLKQAESYKETIGLAADKFLSGATGLAVLTNIAAIASKYTGNENRTKLLDKVGLAAAKLTCVAQGTNLLNKALHRKDSILSLAGFFKVFQSVFDFDKIPAVGGVASGLDQIPMSVTRRLERINEKTNFSSWQEGIQKSFKAIGAINKDFFSNPKKFINEIHKNKNLDELYYIFATAMMAGGVGAGLTNNPIFPIIRHIGGISTDYTLLKSEDNPNGKRAGYSYLGAGITDVIGTLGKNYASHHLATLLNLVGDAFYIFGVKMDNDDKKRG